VIRQLLRDFAAALTARGVPPTQVKFGNPANMSHPIASQLKPRRKSPLGYALYERRGPGKTRIPTRYGYGSKKPLPDDASLTALDLVTPDGQLWKFPHVDLTPELIAGGIDP
jgi:hypothetical protein